MSEMEQKGENGWVINTGIACLVLGFVIAGAVMWQYVYNKGVFFFNKEDGFSEMANVLSGTSGLLFTIAGVIFFTYSLYQTREDMNQSRNLFSEDMKQTRDIFKAQLAESTFFNLIRHHRELVAAKNVVGKDVVMFTSKINEMRKALTRYKLDLKNGIFENFYSTQMSPKPLYENSPLSMVIGRSLIHVANLIFDKLENDEFYHNTFYMGMTNEEKFLIGMIIENKLEPNIKSYSINYSEFFEKVSKYVNPEKSGYMPPLKASHLNEVQFFLHRLDLQALIETEEQIERLTDLKIEGLEQTKLKHTWFAYQYVPASDDKLVIKSKNFIDKPPQPVTLYPIMERLIEVFPLLPDGGYIDTEVKIICTMGHNDYVIAFAKIRFALRHAKPYAYIDHRSEYVRSLMQKFGVDHVHQITVTTLIPPDPDFDEF